MATEEICPVDSQLCRLDQRPKAALVGGKQHSVVDMGFFNREISGGKPDSAKGFR